MIDTNTKDRIVEYAYILAVDALTVLKIFCELYTCRITTI